MAPPVIINVYYTIKDGIEDGEDGDYADFIMKLRCHLARHMDKVKEDVEGHPVLPKRTPARPARWIYIHLAIYGEDSHVILAVRDDNVYLVGFGNYDQQQQDRKRRRVWYEFGFEGETERLLPGSMFLQCDFDYPSLLDGSSFKLKRDVDLSKGKVMEAVRWLSAYKQSSRTDPGFVLDDHTKRDLARLIVVVCESARMIPHFNTVNNSWRQSTCAETLLDEQQVCYLLNWGNMSQALMEWKWYRENRGEDDYWPQDLTKGVADVNNSDEALQVVQLLLKRKLFWRPPPPGQGPRRWWHAATAPRRRRHAATAQGHPLVEVFALRAAAADDFHVYSGIAVFDGKRGQIIYKPLQIQAGAAEADAVVGGEDHAVPFVNGFVQLVARGVSVLREAIASWVLGRQHDDAPVPVHNSTQGERRDLLLTGPYRAISASGCVSIAAVNTVAAEADDDSIGDDGTSLLWDYYDEANAVYDKPLTRTIHTAHGRPLEVIYAVLSDAVQAKVQVYMSSSSLLAQDGGGAATADILVHGRIVARSRAFDDDDNVDTDMDARCALFSRDSDDKVAVDVTPDNYQVPLVRSILAVPLGSPLLIEATLHASAAAAADQAGVDFVVSAEFHPEPSGNKEQRFLVVRDDELRMKTTALLVEPSTEKHEGYIHTGYDSILVKVIWGSDL